MKKFALGAFLFVAAVCACQPTNYNSAYNYNTNRIARACGFRKPVPKAVAASPGDRDEFNGSHSEMQGWNA